MLRVSDVKIFPFEPGDLQRNLKAYAEILLDDSLIIKGIKVFERENGGIFIAFPALQGKDKTFHDVVVPKTPEVKKMIRDAVVEAYKQKRTE
ncbi:MAG: SpoVG family protein [Nitrospinota bacterium]|nr:SpoVG family protein [Nitrospinota bacterium]